MGLGMASVQKTGRRWRVQLYVNGKRESGTFATKQEAAQWALQRESELTGARLPDKTLDDALARYERDVAPSLKSSVWALKKLKNLRKFPLAKKRLASITGPDLADWRDARLRQVKASTVNRELNLLSAVFHTARRDWGWLTESPLTDVRRPTPPKSRKQRISDDQIRELCAGLGYVTGPPQNLSQRVALAFQFAIETAMRGGEIVRLQRADIGALSVKLPDTKNGDQREVPLSSRARAILALLHQSDDPVFGLNDANRDALFRKGRKKTKVVGITFHDSRAEAIWRLSKKLDVFELARMIGHRDIRSLMIYYNTTADELAAKLG